LLNNKLYLPLFSKNKIMNPNPNLLLISLTAIFFLTFNSCSDDHESDMQSIAGDTQDQLITFISEKNSSYTGRFPDFPGGMAAYVLHDSVAEYAHAGMDEGFTDNFHFRAQSTTKTFTAAAIMLLHQEGKLDISHYITNNIPGKKQMLYSVHARL